MPLYCIHAFDKPDSADIRAASYAAHRAYLAGAAAIGVMIHASGPMMDDAGAQAVGSLFVIEAADKEAALRFNAGDPFAAAGLWARVDVTRFDLRRGSVGAARPPGA
jgi:uncharacterized protein